MTVFKLPDLGEGLREAEVVEWHAAAGDEVEAGATLVSVETEKSVVDIPSPQSGRIRRLCAEVGDVVPTGAPLVEFEGGEGAAADSGTVVGRIEVGDRELKETATTERGGRGARIRATPAVRALARKLEIDLSIVTPTGPDGAISAEDVRRVADRFRELGPIELLRGVRRVMAAKMMQTGAEVIPAAVFDDADVDHWPSDEDTTVRLLLALAAGCRAEPALNAWFDSHSLGRRLLARIDVAVAVDTAEGLFTPVLRDVGNRDRSDLAQGLDRLKADVSARSIPAADMMGYSITLSNFGSIAGRYAVPVVLAPTVAILGAGRIERRPVAVEDAVVAHRVLPLSLTFDHRAVTGGEAARFLATVVEDLEKPA